MVFKLKISKDVIIVKKPHLTYYGLNCLKHPAQFSCDLEPDDILGREFSGQAVKKLKDFDIDVVTDMDRQLMKDGQIYTFNTYQIVDYGNLTEMEIKEIAEICDKSWRI